MRRLLIGFGALFALATASWAQAEIVQKDNLRVTFRGELTPKALPRHGDAPVKVGVSTKIAAVGGKQLSQLRTIEIEINRFGHFSLAGLPVCTEDDIQPATTQNALRACGDSLVGTGSFSAQILYKQQAPYPASGKLYAFGGQYQGKPAILAHVYGTEPVPTSFTFAFVLSKKRGTYGTALKASFPEVTGNAGYITGISLNLGKTFKAGGKSRSLLSASCPAPKGLNRASFPLARASLAFPGRTMRVTLTRSCKALGR